MNRPLTWHPLTRQFTRHEVDEQARLEMRSRNLFREAVNKVRDRENIQLAVSSNVLDGGWSAVQREQSELHGALLNHFNEYQTSWMKVFSYAMK